MIILFNKPKIKGDMRIMREGHFLACLNFETLYLIGGDNYIQSNKLVSNLERYDLNSNEWTVIN